MKRWPVWLVALFAAGLGVCWLTGNFATRPAKSTVASFGPGEERVKLVSSDGIRISGTYLPGRTAHAPAILFLHGLTASRDQFLTQAQWLNTQGYATLAVDFRGHGESQQVPRSFGWNESRDARAAYDWLKARQGHDRIAIVGMSLGGVAALLGQNGPIPAKALVLGAVYPDIDHAIGNRIAAFLGQWIGKLGTPFLSYQSRLRFGCWPSEISPIRALARYHGPVMVIGGGADQYTPPDETRAMFDAATGPKQIWITAGLEHARVASDSSEFRQRVGGFLEQVLPPE